MEISAGGVRHCPVPCPYKILLSRLLISVTREAELFGAGGQILKNCTKNVKSNLHMVISVNDRSHFEIS